MGDDLLKFDHYLSGVDIGDATDDGKSLVNEHQNCCDDDSKQRSQNAEDDVPGFDELGEDHSRQLSQDAKDHVPVFDELGEDHSRQLSQNAKDNVPVFDELAEYDFLGQLFNENPQELSWYAENHVPMYDNNAEYDFLGLLFNENPQELASYAENHVPMYDNNAEYDFLGQLFNENPQDLAWYAENHVPMYDNNDYGPARLRKIRFTLAHSHRYATHGLDMLEHAALLLTELAELPPRGQSNHVLEAKLEGVIQWAEQMGAYAEVLDDYCDEVHDFALFLIDFDLEDPMFARHRQLEVVADELLRVQRQMIARVTVERENIKLRQAWYQESLNFMYPNFPTEDVKAQSAED